MMDDNTPFQKAMVIEYEGERGILFCLGENLSQTWQSGDKIVLWEDGEQTIPPDEYKIIFTNAYFGSNAKKKNGDFKMTYETQQEKKKFYQKWWFWVIVVIIVLGLLSSLGGDDDTTPVSTDSNTAAPIDELESQAPTTAPTEEKTVIVFGDIIEVGNFQVVFEKYEILPIDNQYADYTEALIITAKITNISDETESLINIDVTVFTPQGTEGDDMSVYLSDGRNPYLHDDLRSGATYEYHEIIAYTGDGEYIIEVGTLFGDPVELFFDVVK